MLVIPSERKRVEGSTGRFPNRSSRSLDSLRSLGMTFHRCSPDVEMDATRAIGLPTPDEETAHDMRPRLVATADHRGQHEVPRLVRRSAPVERLESPGPRVVHVGPESIDLGAPGLRTLTGRRNQLGVVGVGPRHRAKVTALEQLLKA